MENAVRLVECCVSLDSLTIDLGLRATADGIENQNERRICWNVPGKDDFALRLWKPTTCHADCPACKVLQSLWKPFENVRGVKQFNLSGHINEEYAKELVAGMRREWEV